MNNGICDRFTDSRFDIPQFIQCGIQLSRKAGCRYTGKSLVAAATEKFQCHIVFHALHMYTPLISIFLLMIDCWGDIVSPVRCHMIAIHHTIGSSSCVRLLRLPILFLVGMQHAAV